MRTEIGRAVAVWIGLAVVCGVLAGGAIAAPVAPLGALSGAQSQLSALVGGADPAGKSALDDALARLSAATAASLWSSQSDAVPPPEGDEVFTNAGAAVADIDGLASDPTVSRSQLAAARSELLAAGATLAAGALAQAGLRDVAGDDSSLAEDQALYDQAFHAFGARITAELTSIPQSTIDRAAALFLRSRSEQLDFYPQPISGSPLTSGGKPELFYYGAEFCPFCGADRWSIALALAQFGRFSPLGLMVSSTQDIYRSTNTLTFDGSVYASPLVAFAPVEGYTNQPCATCTPFPFATQQSLTSSEQQLIDLYDQYESLPFLDVGGRWASIGTYPDPSLVEGLSWSQIVSALSDPSSPVAETVEGGAELLAAQLCQATSERPRRVCEDPVNNDYQRLLGDAPITIDPTLYPIDSVSCASEALCVAVDQGGNVVTADDASAIPPSWSAPSDIDTTNIFNYVSCPSTSLCVASDAEGSVLSTSDPGSPTPTWSSPENIDGTNGLSVSCASVSLCVAVDTTGNVLVSHGPVTTPAVWSAPEKIDGTNAFYDISCPSDTLCAAVDDAGNVVISDDPDANTPAWSPPVNIDGTNTISGVSCVAAEMCVAVDAAGRVLITHNPAARTPAWSAPAEIDANNQLIAVSCPTISLCVATDDLGGVLVTHDPEAPTPAWTNNRISGVALDGVSCPSANLCVAAGGNDYAYVTHDPSAAEPTWNAHARTPKLTIWRSVCQVSSVHCLPSLLPFGGW